MNDLTRRLTALATGFGVTLAVAAAPASAKTVTLHFFEKGVSSSFSDANGQPLSPNAAPAPGDRFSFASDEYAGNHKHHAKHPTASSHVDCTVGASQTAICDGQFALGGSLLLADNFTLNLNSQGSAAVALKGGTGRFKHAHGHLATKPVGNPNNNTNDVTITITS
jgi:hypothetical protein